MKKIIILFLFINSLNLFSQDKIDPSPVFDKNDYPDVINHKLDSKFVIGWNWDMGGRDIDSAMMTDFDR